MWFPGRAAGKSTASCKGEAHFKFGGEARFRNRPVKVFPLPNRPVGM